MALSLLLLGALRSNLQLSNHPDSVADQPAVTFPKGGEARTRPFAGR